MCGCGIDGSLLRVTYSEPMVCNRFFVDHSHSTQLSLDSTPRFHPSLMTPLPRNFTSSTQASDAASRSKTPTDSPAGNVSEEIFISSTTRKLSSVSPSEPLSTVPPLPTTTKIIHHHVQALDPTRVVRMDATADSLTSNLNPSKTNNPFLDAVMAPEQKQVTTTTTTTTTLSPAKSPAKSPLQPTSNSSAAPVTVIEHPENDTIVSHDAVIREPNNTVILAQNAIIVNNAKGGTPESVAADSTVVTDPDAPADHQPKVRRTKDGRTKVEGGGAHGHHGEAQDHTQHGGGATDTTTVVETREGVNEPKTTQIIEHRHDDDLGVRRGRSPITPTDGRDIDHSRTTITEFNPRSSRPRERPSVEVPHDLAPPQSPSSSSSYSSYSTVTPAGAGPVYSARSLQPDRVASPLTASYSSYTPSSAYPQSRPSSKVSFREPISRGPYSITMRNSRSQPQVVGDRVEPGLPSIYSPRPASPGSGSTSPGSSYTSSTRSRPIQSRPGSAYSRVATPVVRETKDLKNTNREVQFFTKKVESVAHMLTVDLRQGLSDEEASKRVAIFGENKLKKEKKVSAFRLFLGQLITSINIILFIAAAGAIVSAIVEGSYGWIEGIVIALIIISNSVIGFSQEYRSAKTIESLMNMFAPEAEVIRNGQRKTIAADQLVPGDIVLLEDGDFVPADMRVIEAVNMSIDEAVITGESEPVNKITTPIKAEEGEAIGDRKNMAFMSAVVCGGRGKGVVVRTGEDTELGQIAQKLRSTDKDKKKTHLQQAMAKLGYVLLLCAVALSFIVLAIQVLAVGTEAFGERHTWLYIVALCVAIIPEGLPAVLALTLAVGMRQMAKKNAIVRKLGVLESLNWITDICSDKTGTLTEGKMMATMIWTENNFFKISGTGIIPEGQITEKGGSLVTVETLEEDRTLTLLFWVCSLCNMATLTHENDEWTATSSPTEIALQVLAHKAGLGKPTLEREFRFLGEFPFDSNSKRMSVAYERREVALTEEEFAQEQAQADSDIAPGDASRTYLFMKGSLESVIKNCAYYKDEDGDEVEIDDDIIKNVQEQAEAMAGLGLRVLSMAYKCNFQFNQKDSRDNNDAGSTFLGLVGIMDPPRPQSRPAVEKAHAAGINVYMLTGDHKKTAAAISKQVSIIENEATDRVMVGSEFEQIKIAGDLPKVVARCNPNTKIKMIDDLHSRDRFVCMTGDGVNDAPAIKKSDVGVAMGLNGSEVTKDSADIVLMDDNFGTIIVAIEEGRRVFANIGKIMLHMLANNFALVIVLVFGLIYSFFVDGIIVFPLSPMQILWLNVVTDTPVNAALGCEPATPDIMAHPPRTKGEGLFNLELTIDVLFYGVFAGVLALTNFGITLFTEDGDPADVTEMYGKDVEIALYRARAVAFVSLIYMMLFHVFNCAHPRNSVLLYRGKNIWLWLTVLIGAVLVIPIIYIPWVNVHVFLHYNLTWVEWIQIFAAVAIFAVASEVYKVMKRCFLGAYRNGHYLIHLAERTTNAIADMNRLMILQTERMDPAYTDKKTEISLV